jgi:hypothetical protein
MQDWRLAHSQGRPHRHEPGNHPDPRPGLVFLFLQLYDYNELVTEHGFGINSGVYGTLFYTLTGFHGAHVFGGVVGMSVVLARGLAGQFSARHPRRRRGCQCVLALRRRSLDRPVHDHLPAEVGRADVRLAQRNHLGHHLHRRRAALLWVQGSGATMDRAGVTMLIILGAAMMFTFTILLRGSRGL